MDSLAQWSGLPVKSISFEGVAVSRLAPLPGHLAQAEGAPLSPEKLKESLRQLYATGLFETIEVEGSRRQDGVALVFRGTPRTFIGAVSVDGAKGANVNTQLERACQLDPGTRFTPAKLSIATEQMRRTLALNGFHSPVDYPNPDPASRGTTGRYCVSCGQRTAGAGGFGPGYGRLGNDHRRIPPRRPPQNRRPRGPRHAQPRTDRSAEALPAARSGWKPRSSWNQRR